MDIRNSIKYPIENLKANKLRSFLTMLGIIVGISAVIIIVAVGAGAQSLIINQIESVGSNLVGVLPGGSDEEGPPASIMGIVITTLTNDDLEALTDKKNVPHLVAAAGYAKGNTTLTWQNKSQGLNYTGVSASYINVENAKIETGRFFTISDESSLARVIILGNQIKEDIFNDQDPINQNVKLGNHTFRVIGILEKRGVSGMENQDLQVFIPVTTAQKLMLGINHLGLIRGSVNSAENMDKTVEDIRMTLRERHDITDPTQDDFTVENSAQAVEALTSITDALKYFLVGIAAISLLVGGIGIMNIMIVSVTERIKEIGLRKAVGATNKNIRNQFLIETIVISLVGGTIGIIIGIAISTIVALVAQKMGYNWDLVISISSILVATSVSVLIGIIFGLYPAQSAAKLHPIEALKFE